MKLCTRLRIIANLLKKIDDAIQFCQTTFKGFGVDITTSLFSLSQIVKEPANILNCILYCVNFDFST